MLIICSRVRKPVLCSRIVFTSSGVRGAKKTSDGSMGHKKARSGGMKAVLTCGAVI